MKGISCRFARWIFGCFLLFVALTAAALAQPDDAELYAFSHFAGPLGGSGNADGTGSATRFSNPNGLAVDTAGNVYVSDSGSAGVRRITPAGVVTTLPPTADSYWSPAGVAVDTGGNVYVSDYNNRTISRIAPDGVITVLARGPNIGFLYPQGLALDGAGNLYIADPYENMIVTMTTAGAGAHGYAGLTLQPGSADGTDYAQFRNPVAVTIDSSGNVYVADRGNNTIRKIAPSGVVATLAGTAGVTGSADGAGAAAQFNSPSGVAVDLAGNVYVADTGNATIRKIMPNGAVTTFAGMPGAFGSVDGMGAAARFHGPAALAVDGSGNVFVGDGDTIGTPGNYGGAIRKITPTGRVTTIAGLAGDHGNVDGNATTARFDGPQSVAADTAGNVYVADTANSTIRKVTAAGVVITFAGAAGQTGSVDGVGTAARFNQPTGVAVELAGNVYVADHDNNTIRKITQAGVVTTLAGTAGYFGSTDGTGAAAAFHHPVGLAVDSGGNLYVSDGDYLPGGDPIEGWGTIRKVTASGVVTTLAGNPIVHDYYDHSPYEEGWFIFPKGMAIDESGTVYVADQEAGILKVAPDGTVSMVIAVDEAGKTVWLAGSTGVVVDHGGNLYVTNKYFSDLIKITPAGLVTTVAGNPISIGGTATWGITVVHGGADGVGAAVQFNSPTGLVMDGQGNFYVADTGNNAIRKGQLVGPPVITSQPQSQTVTAGSDVQFTVSATGVPAPTYQWYVNGSAFSGATTNTLSFATARSSDAGAYTVVVTNAVGSITSNAATLTVSAAPVTPPTTPASSGGGGSPSLWFYGALALLASARRFSRVGTANPS